MKSWIISMIAVVIAFSFLMSGCRIVETSTPSPKTPLASPVKGATKAEWEIRWEKLVSAAKEEGKVVFYGEAGPVLQDKLIRVFKERYGIEVEILPGKAPEVAQKYLTERSANLSLADVLMTGQTTTLATIKPKGVLTSPKPYLILPEVLDAKAWPGGALPFLDKDELALALIASRSRTVAINTEQVKNEEIGSYTDLLNPKWKGRITLYDPSMSGTGSTWLAFMFRVFGREAGEKYLRQLANLEPAVTRDTRLHAETIAKGKYSIGIGPSPQVITDLAQAGAPLGWPTMKEGSLVMTGAFVVALPDKPAHPNAAALMLNYLLSKDGQLVVSEAAGGPARRLDVSTQYATPGTVPEPGDFWLDEDFFMSVNKYYPIAKEIFGLR